MALFLLLSIGILSRLVPHVSQFTAIIAVSLCAGLYLSRRQAFWAPLAVMAVTDVILGFHDTMVFTWGSMMLIAAMGHALRAHRRLGTVMAAGVGGALIFFVITNIGAWLSPLYPQTLQGLKECFINAVPFYRTTLLSTVVYTAVLYFVLERLAEPAARARVLKA